MGALRIGVIGGGLGGLTAGIALRRAGHDVDVFEQSKQFRPVGAGISLWSNGVKVLRAVGLADRVAELGGRMDRMRYSDMAGTMLTDFSLEPLYDTVSERSWPLARADLQDLLLKALGVEHVTFGAKCVSVDSDASSAAATFADGSRFEGDLVVGADGTHSSLRSWVAGEPLERQYVGYVNFNGLADIDETIAPAHTWVTWVGEGKRASVMPIGAGRHYTFFDLPVASEEAARPDQSTVIDELRAGFGGWAEPVARLIEAMDPARINRVLIYDLVPVKRWFRDRVVLLGDAVHAMAPDLGQGGCQALEDALVLARLLSDPSLELATALSRYESERAPRTAEIVRRARKRALITHGLGSATADWYQELKGETGETIIAGIVESVVTGPCQ